MDRKSERLGSSLGLPTLLTLIFLVLKLTGVINWSWVWVLSPIWISVGLVVLFAVCLVIVEVVTKRRK